MQENSLASLLKNLEKLDISLSDEDLDKVLERVVKLGSMKTTITSDDLPFIIAEVLEGKDYHHIELLNCSITSGLDLDSTASIRLRIRDKIYKSAGTGNGGFDAFIAALKKALSREGIGMPSLVDYEVRIPRGGRTDALTECIITWDSEGEKFRTRGVHSNQVFAAMKSTIRMLNRQLQQIETTP